MNFCSIFKLTRVDVGNDSKKGKNKSVSCNYTKSLENKTTRNIVNASYLFTQFSTLAKTYTTTAREPSIYAKPNDVCFATEWLLTNTRCVTTADVAMRETRLQLILNRKWQPHLKKKRLTVRPAISASCSLQRRHNTTRTSMRFIRYRCNGLDQCGQDH